MDSRGAASIRDPVILQRALTICCDVNRLTRPLGIDDPIDRLPTSDGSPHQQSWLQAGAARTTMLSV
jgi:hypothetical protein